MTSNKLIISAKNADRITGKRMIDAAYEYYDSEKNKTLMRALLDNGDIVEVERTKEVKKALLELTRDNMYSIEIELGKKGISDEKVKRWVENHPDMEDALGLTGVKRSDSLYLFTITGEQLEATFNDDDEKAEVFDKYKAMSEAEHKGIAIHFGIEPWRLDDRELRNALVGFNTGAISVDRAKRTEFLNHVDAIFDYKQLNVASAILSGVIVNEDGVYTLEGISLGKTKEYAVATFNERSDLYSILERKLKERGRYLAPFDGGKAKINSKIASKNSATKKEMADLGIESGSFVLEGSPKDI
jgi:hypothetical protein